MGTENDLLVYTGPDIPCTFRDAYAVNTDGVLSVFPWSTRQVVKRVPTAEFATGSWTFYRHLGEQGGEPLDPAAPRHPLDQDAALGDREGPPGNPATLRPATIRPALPPGDFVASAERLPQRPTRPRVALPGPASIPQHGRYLDVDVAVIGRTLR